MQNARWQPQYIHVFRLRLPTDILIVSSRVVFVLCLSVLFWFPEIYYFTVSCVFTLWLPTGVMIARRGLLV